MGGRIEKVASFFRKTRKPEIVLPRQEELPPVLFAESLAHPHTARFIESVPEQFMNPQDFAGDLEIKWLLTHERHPAAAPFRNSAFRFLFFGAADVGQLRTLAFDQETQKLRKSFVALHFEMSPRGLIVFKNRRGQRKPLSDA